MAKKKSKQQQQQQAASSSGVESSTVIADSKVSGGASLPSLTDNDTNQGVNEENVGGEEEEEMEMELFQVDLGDIVKIKQVLDETVAGTVLEHLPEDYRWDNFKLSIMALACTFAMIAQFAPVPFPDSRPILGICGTLYFFFSGILQIATFIDQDAIVWTLPTLESKNTDMNKYGLVIRTSLERYSEWYTVTIQFHNNQVKDLLQNQQASLDSSKSNTIKPSFAQQRWSIGQFFDKEGYFDEIGVSLEIEKLLKRFEEGNYDQTPLSENKSSKAKSE